MRVGHLTVQTEMLLFNQAFFYCLFTYFLLSNRGGGGGDKDGTSPSGIIFVVQYLVLQFPLG